MKHDSADHHDYITDGLQTIPLVVYLDEVDAGVWQVVHYFLASDAGEVAAGDLAAEIATLGEAGFYRRLVEQYHDAKRFRDFH